MTAAVFATGVLLRIREHIASSEPVADEDARYFLRAIDQWLSGTDFAAAFGVKPGPGEADPRTRIAENRRDELIRTAAQSFFGDVPAARRAEELHRAWARYFDGAWQTMDRKLADCPTRYAGKLAGLLYEMTKLRPRVLSERQIRRILAMRPPGFVATKVWSKETGRSSRQTDGAASFQGSEAIHVPATNPTNTHQPVFGAGEGNIHGT